MQINTISETRYSRLNVENILLNGGSLIQSMWLATMDCRRCVQDLVHYEHLHPYIAEHILETNDSHVDECR